MSTERVIAASTLRGGVSKLGSTASAGEQGPIAALYDQHAAGLYAYVLAITADAADAEDIVHEVFERALARHQGFFGLRNPVGYMYRAARNAAYDRLRRLEVRERSRDRIATPAVLESIEPLTEAERAQQMNEALSALPVEQREVVLLRFYQEMTFSQIARVMGGSANTAASRCRYALTKLREILGDEDDGRD
ncbi:MAG: sigma-70 family RNA polymerase sigma factor [Candidatus Hydrogenedentes bacterium]|nr:sigma-70 family RNA polymerase sigma factor [Candidatus Hydrogenedentota bacterium]